MKPIIVILILFLFVVAGLFGLGFYGLKAGWFESLFHKDQTKIVPKVFTNYSFLILDYETKEKIPADFKLFILRKNTECLTGEQKNLLLRNSSRFKEVYGIEPSELNVDDCYVKSIDYLPLKEGSLTAGFNNVELEVNNTYALFAYGKDYYVGQIIFFVGNAPNQKSIYELWHKPVLNLSFEKGLSLQSNSLYKENIVLDVKHLIERVIVCTKWSFGFIYVRPTNAFQQVPAPSRLPNVDECWLVPNSAINNQTIIPLSIKTELLTPADYFTIYILDSERFWNGKEWREGLEDLIGNDIGVPDYEKNFTIALTIQ